MAYPQRFGFGFGQMPMQQTFVTGYAPVNMGLVTPVVPVVPAPAYTFIQTPTIITSIGARPMKRRDPPMEKPPTTTVFVGNINEKVPNDVIKAMLQKCGSTGMNWRRVQGSNGKFQAFGFCEYDHPNSTFRALRLLNDWPLGDKKLVVKVDEKTKKVLNEFVNRRRVVQGKSTINVDGDLPEPDADEKAEDEMFRQQITDLVKEQLADLEKSTEEGEIPSAATVFGLKRGNLEEMDDLDDTKREYIEREINQFREAHKEEKPEKKRRSSSKERSSGRDRSGRDRSSRKGDTSGGKSILIDITDDPLTPRKRRISDGPTQRYSRSPSPPGGDRRNKRKRKEISPVPLKARSRSKSRNSSRRRSRSRDEEVVSDDGSLERRTKARRAPSESSEEDEEAIERKRQERKIREKEVAYQERLRKWEVRERKKMKEFEKESKKEKTQRKEEQKEAKKLKEFLEDYEDERDDPKFYKGAALQARRREFEREKETDMRDRKKEKEELEEIKKKLTDEGYANPDAEIERLQRIQEEKLLRRMRNSVSSSPASEILKRKAGEDDGSDSSASESGDEEEMQSTQDSRAPSVSVQSDTPKQGPESFKPVETAPTEIRPFGAPVIKLGLAPPVVAPIVKKVFNVDEEESEKKRSRPLVPLTYTEEEKQAVQSTSEPMSSEQKKQAIKKLIEQIPTSKEELFAYPIQWDYVDDVLLDKRVKPWVTKKIVEYIGEEEPSLVDFICKKLMKKSTPLNLLDDVQMVLDEEAEVFVVKMWRLLIYEVEAKKQGLVKDP